GAFLRTSKTRPAPSIYTNRSSISGEAFSRHPTQVRSEDDSSSPPAPSASIGSCFPRLLTYLFLLPECRIGASFHTDPFVDPSKNPNPVNATSEQLLDVFINRAVLRYFCINSVCISNFGADTFISAFTVRRLSNFTLRGFCFRNFGNFTLRGKFRFFIQVFLLAHGK